MMTNSAGHLQAANVSNGTSNMLAPTIPSVLMVDCCVFAGNFRVPNWIVYQLIFWSTPFLFQQAQPKSRILPWDAMVWIILRDQRVTTLCFDFSQPMFCTGQLTFLVTLAVIYMLRWQLSWIVLRMGQCVTNASLQKLLFYCSLVNALLVCIPAPIHYRQQPTPPKVFVWLH